MSAMERYMAQSSMAEGNLSRISQADYEGQMAKFSGEQELLGDQINLGNEETMRDIAKEGVFAGGLAGIKTFTKGAQKVATTVGKTANSVGNVVERMGGDPSAIRSFGTAVENGGNILDSTANGRLADSICTTWCI